MKKFFPRFLWLMRDVTLAMTDRAGQTISATEFLHTRLLTSQSGQPTELGKSLCSLFPSQECHTLPMPTLNSKLIKHVVEQEDKLDPGFNEGVDELIQRILQQVTPKKAIDGVNVVNGPILAAMTREYVDAVNTPGAIPDLEQGWQAIIKWKLKELSDNLVEDYRREMEEYLRGNHPMEDRNLMRIHEQTLNRKSELLQQEIHRLKPLSSTFGDIDPILSQLEKTITQTNEVGEVIGGGVLYQFTTQNYSKSKQQCEEVLMEVMKNSGIHKTFQEAFMNSQPLDIMVEMQEIDELYQAVGPAANKVMEKGHRELNQLGDLLKKIPGPPSEVKVIGQGPDRVKLSWQAPTINPEAAEFYEVWKKKEGEQNWEGPEKTQKTQKLIEGLKPGKGYQFQVTATNEVIKSVATTKKFLSNTMAGIYSTLIGLVLSPIAYGLVIGNNLENRSDKEWSTSKKVAIYGALSAATLPFGLACPLETVSSMAVQNARLCLGSPFCTGDLSADSDDDETCPDSTE